MKRKARFKINLLIAIFSILPFCARGESIFQKHFDRREVQKAIRQFLTIEREFFEKGLRNAEMYVPIVKDIFINQGLPEELAYLPIIESGYSVNATSPAGAAGIWQFVPTTARWYRLRMDFWVDERRDPLKSTEKAARHLKDLYEYYRGWELALAAYNAGMGAVNLAIKQGRTSDYWRLCDMRLLKKETMEYVPRFIAAVSIARNPSAYGFSPDGAASYPEYETITVEHPIDLTVFSREAAIQLKTLLFLNPELIRMMTPIGRTYQLRVPKERHAEALRVYFSLPKEELVGVKPYTVRFGDTLGEIARVYRTDTYLLKLINGIQNPRMLHAGRTILIPIRDNVRIESIEEKLPPLKDFSTQEIVYTVQKSDTLWSIAEKFGSDLETLIVINGLSYNSIIMPGDDIKVWVDIPFQR